jgi:hypothetical protein
VQALVESLILIAYVVWCIRLITIEESGKILGKELRSARVINMEERNLLEEKDAVVAAEKQELWLCNLGLWFWLKCFFALLCILIVDALLNPVIWNSTKKMDMTQAISNTIYLVILS